MVRALIVGLSVMASVAPGCSGPDRDLPAAYRRLAVPTALLASRDAQRQGRTLYVEHCAICHGVHADGRGVRREGFAQPPRDFTDGNWRRSVSPRRVFFLIREGIGGTPMAAWPAFSDEQSWDLVAYLRSVSRDEP